MADNKKVFEKLEKILAKTKPGSNASDNEVEIALAAVNKLLTENNLSMAEFDEFSRTNQLGELTFNKFSEEKKWYLWEQSLASQVALFFDCRVVLTKQKRSKKSQMSFVGREENIRTSILMFSWLDQDCLLKASGYKKGCGRAWLDYCTGFVSGITEKIEAQLKQREESFVKAGKELMILNEAEQFLKKAFKPEIRKLALDYSESQAYREGEKEGKQKSLNHQVGLKGLEYKAG